jgi:hypothetical protein
MVRPLAPPPFLSGIWNSAAAASYFAGKKDLDPFR